MFENLRFEGHLSKVLKYTKFSTYSRTAVRSTRVLYYSSTIQLCTLVYDITILDGIYASGSCPVLNIYGKYTVYLLVGIFMYFFKKNIRRIRAYADNTRDIRCNLIF